MSKDMLERDERREEGSRGERDVRWLIVQFFHHEEFLQPFPTLEDHRDRVHTNTVEGK
jgi:hypothetical protein